MKFLRISSELQAFTSTSLQPSTDSYPTEEHQHTDVKDAGPFSVSVWIMTRLLVCIGQCLCICASVNNFFHVFFVHIFISMYLYLHEYMYLCALKYVHINYCFIFVVVCICICAVDLFLHYYVCIWHISM